MLDFINSTRGELIDCVKLVMIARIGGDRDQAIVANRFVTFGLLSFDYPNQPRRYQATREGGLIHERQHVEGITIFATRRRHEAEIKRKDRAEGKDAAESEKSQFRIEIELVSAAFGRFDHNVAVSSITGERG